MQVCLLTGNNREERGLFRRPWNPTLHVPGGAFEPPLTGLSDRSKNPSQLGSWKFLPPRQRGSFSCN
jgi:hypothetical protein